MMPEGWNILSVEKIARVIRGASPRPKGDPRYYGGNIPRLMVADVTRDGKYVIPIIDYLTEDGANRSRMVPAGTLTIVCSGTVGIPSILAVDACIHDGFLALAEISDNYDIEYLYYVFARLQRDFDSVATHGGVFTNLTTNILKDFTILLPPISEQKKIAAILSSVDDAIQATQAVIDQTRTVKQGLLQQLLNRGIGHTRFKQTEIGEIPEEWDLTSLANLGQSDRPAIKAGPFGSALKKSFYVANGYKVYGQEQVISGDFSIGNYYIDANHFEALKTCAVHPGDILISLVGTFGKSVVVPQNIEQGIINPRLVRLALEPSLVEPLFIKEWLGCSDTQRQLERVSHGGTMGILNAGTFKSLQLPLPPLYEQRQIMNILSSFNETLKAEHAKLQQNIRVKNGLMQDLLTGRVRVKPDEVNTT